MTKAYSDPDGNIHILVPDSFTMMMIDKRETRDQVRAALSICLKKEIGEKAIAFECVASGLPENEEDLILDQIIQKAT